MATVADAAELQAERLAERRARALLGARAAIEALRRMGVRAELIGSLADERFDQTSDVDLLVTECPRRLKYAVESVVEDLLPGFSFDVLYIDELSPERAERYRRASSGDFRS
jgi:hypothetical protein